MGVWQVDHLIELLSLWVRWARSTRPLSLSERGANDGYGCE